VEDNVKVEQVILYYRLDGGTWHNQTMTAGEEPSYQAVVGPFTEGTILDYYIYAEDNSGNHASSPTQSFTIPDPTTSTSTSSTTTSSSSESSSSSENKFSTFNSYFSLASLILLGAIVWLKRRLRKL